jgi:hypothetical protein
MFKIEEDSFSEKGITLQFRVRVKKLRRNLGGVDFVSRIFLPGVFVGIFLSGADTVADGLRHPPIPMPSRLSNSFLFYSN